jgi:hypothetical protein
VSEDLLDGRAVSRVKLEHALNKVLEVFGEEGLATGLVLAVGSPEDICAVGRETSVEWILGLSCGEGRMLGHHDEKNDGCGKQIHGLSLIGLLKVDLRSHVVQSSELRSKISTSISSFHRSSESEISNLKGEGAVEKEVFWF